MQSVYAVGDHTLWLQEALFAPTPWDALNFNSIFEPYILYKKRGQNIVAVADVTRFLEAFLVMVNDELQAEERHAVPPILMDTIQQLRWSLAYIGIRNKHLQLELISVLNKRLIRELRKCTPPITTITGSSLVVVNEVNG